MEVDGMVLKEYRKELDREKERPKRKMEVDRMEKMVTKNIDEILTKEELETLEFFEQDIKSTDVKRIIAQKSFIRGFLSAMELVKYDFENVPGEIFIEKLRSRVADVFEFGSYEEFKKADCVKALGIE